MSIQRVLVATDGSDSALRASQVLADLLSGSRAEIRLLTVLSFELDPYTLLGEELADAQERARMVARAVEEATAPPRRVLEDAGHSISVTHRFGNPADEILEEAEESTPDLVVMGRRGLSGPARWLLGSVSERGIPHARVPVLIVS
jgi:nucleotide-binding universal stress UspA family protein